MNASASETGLGASVLRAFREAGIAVTDNSAQAEVILEVAADIAVQPGSTIGNTSTWQATAAVSLKATDIISRATLLWTTFLGHGSATRADFARQYALDNAAEHLAAEYETFLKASKPSRKQEVNR